MGNRTKTSRTIVWLSRDDDGELYEVHHHSRRPVKDVDGTYSSDIELLICARHFERVTGFRLEPGTCRRVRFAVEPVEDVAKRKPRYVQVRHPVSKRYVRIDRQTGRIVGSRRTRYACPLVRKAPAGVRS